MALPLPTTKAVMLGAVLSFATLTPAMAQDLGTEAFLQAQASSDGDEVGRSVAMNADTIFAGAPGFLNAGQFGQGRVFTWQLGGNSTWQPAASIPAPHPQDQDFGRSIALAGATLVVGAPSSTSAAAQAGAVEVFGRFDGQSWKPVARVIAQDGRTGDAFGSAVAIEGNTLVVGASGDSTKGPSAGAAYVFERSHQSNRWVQVAKLIAPNAEGQDFFGNAVAVRGRRIAVGAPGQDGLQPAGAPIPATDAGRIYIYEKVADTWTLKDQLVIGDPGPGDALGVSVQLEEDRVLAGAPGVDTLRPGQEPPFIANTGAVFEYRRSNGRWRQGQILSAPEKRTNEFLGSSLASSGDTLIAGSRYNPQGDVETGKVLRWTRGANQSAWFYAGELAATAPVSNWGHGNAVALFQRRALVGAPQATKSGGSDEAGAVSVYEMPGAATAPALPKGLGWLTFVALTSCLYWRRSA